MTIDNPYSSNRLQIALILFPLLINALNGLLSESIGLPYATINVVSRVLLVISLYLIFVNNRSRLITPYWTPLFITIVLIDFITIITSDTLVLKNFIDFELIKYGGLFILMFSESRSLNIKILINVIILFYLIIDCVNLLPVLQNSFMRTISAAGASYNYIAALNLVSLPLIIYYTIKSTNTSVNNWILGITQVVMISTVLLSGSRSAYPLLAIIICCEFYYLRKKINILWFFIFVVIAYKLFAFLLDNETFANSVLRATTAGLNSDEVRDDQWSRSYDLWKNNGMVFGLGTPKQDFEILGYTYVHNFILETLLMTGLVGFVVFIIYHIKVLKFITEDVILEKSSIIFLILICLSYFGMAYFHPFITSSFAYDFLYIFNLLALRQIIIQKQHSI